MSEEAPGWDAIDEALAPLYGDQNPKHMGTVVPYELGGPDRIRGISAYRSDHGAAHWHYVTYGFSELFEKSSDDPEFSGFGFELTFRLARRQGETDPPMFAFNLLQNLARYVFNSGNVFEPGHHMDANGPIALETGTKLTALCFIEDPQLPTIDTPHGKVSFVQLIGITGDELQAIKRWNTVGLLGLARQADPVLITDLDRPSWLLDQGFRAAVEAGVERDGSSTGLLFLRNIAFSGDTLILGTLESRTIGPVLASRLKHGNGLIIQSPGPTVRFSPGAASAVTEDDGALHIEVAAEDTDTVVALFAEHVGSHRCHFLASRVERSEIKDPNGNVVEILE